MTLIELLVAYYGRPREVAGTPEAYAQCVDWANSYIRDVLGLTMIEWTDAKDFPSKAGDKYEYIKSTPTNFPVFGDIPIWTGAIGSGHGHIAVALGGDANTFVSTDENWSISQRVTVERHNYDNVDGWLHPKQLVPMITIPVKERDDLVAGSSLAGDYQKLGYGSPIDLDKYIKSLKGSLELQTTLTKQFEAKAKELQDRLDAIVITPPPTPLPVPQNNDLKTFKESLKPYLDGWITYLRSRGAIKKLVYA